MKVAAEHVEAAAEHASLAGWLTESLTAEELRSVGLVSFNQWAFTTAALMETALAAHGLGSTVTVGFWADSTPLHDPGWTTSQRIARLARSRSLDRNAALALIAAGLPPGSLVEPPLRRWAPRGLPDPGHSLSRSEIREVRYQGSPMGRSILQVPPDSNTPVDDAYHWPPRFIERAMRSYAWVYDQTSALIAQRGLTTLVVYNGRFTHDQAAAAAAEASGIRVLYYDAGGLDTGFDLTIASTHDWAHLQERMLQLWDRWGEPDRTEIASTWFTNRQEHKEAGLQAFVEHQTRGHVAGVPDADQLVVFFSSSPDEIAELELDWNEYFASQVGALATLAEACHERPGYALVVRTHPHMRLKPAHDLETWRAAVTKAQPAVHFDAADPTDSYALMRRADLVFTYGSTSGVEAAFVGRPVVVMGPSAYDLLGCAQRARSIDDVRATLDRPPTAEPRRALPYGLMMQRRGFNFERVVCLADGTYELAGIRLDDASEFVRKAGHTLAQRQIRRLTRPL